ncbi:hypothetical protein B0J13DRAFT_128220 [Dactylonectria estremocensis]|uniref:Uncharacterized protein n=1 Tax=Dactylonectria estremocensis TaxID=1079267 RepID=A0A9P9JCM8_9HYPO|nr:hypothetical protein B0J13DRAFT_128220 [Dactylonectria estremocensis]
MVSAPSRASGLLARRHKTQFSSQCQHFLNRINPWLLSQSDLTTKIPQSERTKLVIAQIIHDLEARHLSHRLVAFIAHCKSNRVHTTRSDIRLTRGNLFNVRQHRLPEVVLVVQRLTLDFEQHPMHHRATRVFFVDDKVGPFLGETERAVSVGGHFAARDERLAAHGRHGAGQGDTELDLQPAFPASLERPCLFYHDDLLILIVPAFLRERVESIGWGVLGAVISRTPVENCFHPRIRIGHGESDSRMRPEGCNGA